MTLGERLKYFRKYNKMTQKEVGKKLGYNDRTAGIRVFQYETGRRIPKPSTLQRYADIFGVSIQALEATDVDNELSVIHTLFALEESRGMDFECAENEVFLHLDKGKNNNSVLFEHLSIWQEVKNKYEKGEITKEEYEKWRNSYSDIVVKKQLNM